MDPKTEIKALKKEASEPHNEPLSICGLPCPRLTYGNWGLVMVAAGLVWLLSNLGLFATIGAIWFWPLLLICCGLFTLAAGRRR